MQHTCRTAIVAAALLAWTNAPCEVVVVSPSKDNTLIERADGSRSNGAGPFFFAGATSSDGLRRAALAFDVSGSIPEDSRIDGATLMLEMVGGGSEETTAMGLHRLLADWGEGESAATGGAGAPSEPGDATWIHTFYLCGEKDFDDDDEEDEDFDEDDCSWSAPGGDFVPSPSASARVARPGSYTWGPSAAMTADVQSWLDDPEQAHGWLLLGDETAVSTVKKFASRDHGDESIRPRLTVHFTPPSGDKDG